MQAATGLSAGDEAAMIQQSNTIVDKLAAVVGPAGLDGLTRDEAAAINIYTQDSPVYKVLNSMLLKGDRDPLKQWFPFLKLLFTALHKLPSCPGTYFRGVSADIASQYTEGADIVWWAFSSSTATIKALSDFMQPGKPRVLFSLDVQRVVDINKFSSFVNEDERLLLSGIPLTVKSTMELPGNVTMVQMTEDLGQLPLIPGFTLKPSPPWEVDPNEIKFDKEEDDDGDMVKIELGSGSFGRVYAGRFRGHVVAVKQLPAGNEKMIQDFQKEARITFRLQHSNVAQCYGGSIGKKFVRLISERLEASLHNELHIANVELSAEVVRDIILQVAQGLQYLHQNKVSHRDLKPDNVMRNAKRIWKLIDFGLASSRSSSMASKSTVSGANKGTAGYMAPELYSRGGTHTVDTFAFAMLAYETAMRSPPFAGAAALAVPDMIKSGKRPDLVRTHPNLTAGICQIIQACWNQQPERRPDMLSVAARLMHMVSEEEDDHANDYDLTGDSVVNAAEMEAFAGNPERVSKFVAPNYAQPLSKEGRSLPQAPTLPVRKSTKRGKCERPSPKGGTCKNSKTHGSKFCNSHACPVDGCTASKSSSEEYCPLHAHSGGSKGVMRGHKSVYAGFDANEDEEV